MCVLYLGGLKIGFVRDVILLPGQKFIIYLNDMSGVSGVDD